MVGEEGDHPPHDELMQQLTLLSSNRAIRQNRLHDVMRLVGDHPELVGISDVWGNYPLHYACGLGRAEVAAYLLDQGAPIERLDSQHRTALQLACREGEAEVVKLLISRGANPLQGSGTMTLLMKATSRGHVDVVRYLLTIPVIRDTINTKEEDGGGEDGFGYSALHYACDSPMILTLLVQAGADPTLTKTNGLTAKRLAYGNDECVAILQVSQWA